MQNTTRKYENNHRTHQNPKPVLVGEMMSTQANQRTDADAPTCPRHGQRRSGPTCSGKPSRGTPSHPQSRRLGPQSSGVELEQVVGKTWEGRASFQ